MDEINERIAGIRDILFAPHVSPTAALEGGLRLMAKRDTHTNVRMYTTKELYNLNWSPYRRGDKKYLNPTPSISAMFLSSLDR